MLRALGRLKKDFHGAGCDLRFDRPLLLLQSDDWGRVGIRDREGWEELQARGFRFGEKPYDFYSLETADDLRALCGVLQKHHDSVGRNPCMVMNFILANVDFERCSDSTPGQVPLRPLTEGLPGAWRRPQLFDAYRLGIQEGLFFPALHGLTHFCVKALVRELEGGGERAQLLRRMWSAQTPYIYWRMPWIGYEYWDAELKPALRFLDLDEQRSTIRRAAEVFQEFFHAAPLSACAPGYRANADTAAAWFEAGVRIAQHGPGPRKAPYLDRQEMLHTFRTVTMEPAILARDVEEVVREAEECFRGGVPAVVSIHSLNFHSTLRDFRTPTLGLLDESLSRLETRWPTLLYVHDDDLFRIATEGGYSTLGEKVEVGVRSEEVINRG